MSTSIDTKNLLKIEGLELKTIDHIDLWYYQLHKHAFNHGVHIPPYSTIEQNMIIGSKWVDKIIPKKIKFNRRLMSSALHHLLSMKGFIPDSLPELKDAILPAASNRYRALYNISRLFYPKLKDTDYQRNISKQK